MAGCNPEQFEVLMSTIQDGSFSDDKATFIKTASQNFTFQAEQIAKLLSLFDFTSDRVEAVDLFAHSVVDPNNAGAIAASFDGDEAGAAVAKLGSFKATPPQEIAPHRIEDDGHRSEEAMDRLFAAIDGKNMSSDKVAALEAEIAENPTPPFDTEQLVAILKKFNFSSDKAKVLESLVGPQMVYPMTCEQIISVLKSFSMSSDQIAILPSLKPFIHDAQNKLQIVVSFTFSSDKAKAEEILRDVVVSFKPKTPPQEKIQAALRAIGRCPAGYLWRKVAGGWRCQAGGHYVGDAAISTYLETH